MIMKKLSVDNFVKTSCGIDQYNSLKKNKSIFGKLRLSWFLFFATFRDLFVSKKNTGQDNGAEYLLNQYEIYLSARILITISWV